jgi:hypothetical protein
MAEAAPPTVVNERAIALLLKRGELKRHCSEVINQLQCTGCGDRSSTAAEWAANNESCPVCSANRAFFLCQRCQGQFELALPRGEHECQSVQAFMRRGSVAFRGEVPAETPNTTSHKASHSKPASAASKTPGRRRRFDETISPPIWQVSR